MSKKKSSMSLKDFHGGTIPSDLTLPSAPGVFVRSTNLSGYDRSMSRSTSSGRPDQWVRPNSSPGARIFDDKTPFLGPTVPIGRHFDEDERKPLDGLAAPRRTVSDESFRSPANRVELKPELPSGGRAVGSSAASQPVNSYIGRVVEGGNMGLGMQNAGGNGVQARAPSNPWNTRKEPVVRFDEPVQSSGMVVSVESKIARASALDKVSSGKWQTKQCPFSTDIEVTNGIIPEKVGSLLYEEQNNKKIVGNEIDTMLDRDIGRWLTTGDENYSGRKDISGHEGSRISSSGHQTERIFLGTHEKPQPSLVDGRFGYQATPPTGQLDASERPKLKLLPRTKPTEGPEILVLDHKMDLPVNVKPITSGADSESLVLERRRLNLKPRSQTTELSDGSRDRGALFGGARPREMVLKDRGIDDTVLSNQDVAQRHERVKQNVKVERVGQPTYAKQPVERTINPINNPPALKNTEREDQPVDPDARRTNWRKDNWKNNKDGEKHQPQQQRERPPSPESWRKPVEAEKAAPPHFGKTASALELTQAFARPVSDSKLAPGSYRSQPGKSQMPFSRLMDATQQINGY